MKIERDKWYLRRDGGREFVICVDKPGDESIVTHDTRGSVSLYHASGRLFEGKETHCDLVALAPEPVRGYVAFTRDGLFVGHAIKTEAFGPSLRILDLSTAKEVGDDQ